MFEHGATISAANLLIASQPIARGVQQPCCNAKVQFGGILAKIKTVAAASAFGQSTSNELLRHRPRSLACRRRLRSMRGPEAPPPKLTFMFD
jgi:hypothetical protein